jgi:hypothetical protein
MRESIRLVVVLTVLVFLAFFKSASAQQGSSKSEPIAREAGMYCAGFISEVAPRTDFQIVGAEKENEKDGYNQGDVVYLNKGRESGVQSGAAYYIIRPLGSVKHPFTKKKIGYFNRELGILRVIEVHEKISVAEITVSCDPIEFGDVLKPYEAQVAPGGQDLRPLPRYSEGSSGLTGRIIMSPIAKEYLSANQLAFIDLGNRQGVRAGDHFTIYRRITRGEGVAKIAGDDIVQEKSGGYGSSRFRGGDFSASAPRAPRQDVRRDRPALPRKVMGELVVLKVENTACIALITRTVSEVNIGDFVERMN